MGDGREPLYALVLAGGGARGAYEAGVIHYLRTQLPPKAAKKRFQIYCGSSVGGINTTFLAALADYPKVQGEELRHVWETLRQEDIYRRDLAALGSFGLRSATGAIWNLFRRQSSNPTRGPHFNGFFDTSPFPAFLKRIIPWQHLHRVVREGIVGAVSLTATNLHNGKMELFIDHHSSIVYSGNYTARMGPLHWVQAMASAAIPIMFSPVKIGGIYYADGGVRANTPMSPAIHLGADRLLVVGMHSQSEIASSTSVTTDTGEYPPPTLGDVAGTMLRAMFVDRLDYDLKQLKRINQIVKWGRGAFGDNFLEKLNRVPQKENLVGDIATRGVKAIDAHTIFPSRSLPELLSQSLKSSKRFAKSLSTFEKVIFRVMDIDPYRNNEFLSYFLFTHDYLSALIQLGFDDANSNRDSLIEFLSVE
ncbi:MAG: hypothetical protein COV45_04105 [Deltaproteobacteria bacterium CG11_big_fil_rev_8_21_14_0_20_47_16]|nr:MAG: hypothetical protein COV45_04105 [Deltaproteobacteria bacterium CG11_big_fil_rev_8_21_14_0_20_47_16]